jgi:hypothetical protein
MPNYQNGKIYKIVCNETNEIYIGSTTAPLSRRLVEHVSRCKLYQQQKIKYKTLSSIIIERGNYNIHLIENFPCSNAKELSLREGEIQREYICVNKVIAGRTKKQYSEDNKEHIKQQKKQYWEDNKDNKKQQRKQYYEDNKEHQLNQQKQYYEKNKEIIKQKSNNYYEKKKLEKENKMLQHINESSSVCKAGIYYDREFE